MELPAAVRAISAAPREILSLDVPALEEGSRANLTVFDPSTRWTFERRHIRSKSHNTPYLGWEMVGKAWAIYNRGMLVDNSAS
jgi:dihydroorotase